MRILDFIISKSREQYSSFYEVELQFLTAKRFKKNKIKIAPPPQLIWMPFTLCSLPLMVIIGCWKGWFLNGSWTTVSALGDFFCFIVGTLICRVLNIVLDVDLFQDLEFEVIILIWWFSSQCLGWNFHPLDKKHEIFIWEKSGRETRFVTRGVYDENASPCGVETVRLFFPGILRAFFFLAFLHFSDGTSDMFVHLQ